MELGTGYNVDEEVQILVSEVLQVLEKAGMIRFLRSGSFTSTGKNLCNLYLGDSFRDL
jgi:hypothetical protein